MESFIADRNTNDDLTASKQFFHLQLAGGHAIQSADCPIGAPDTLPASILTGTNGQCCGSSVHEVMLNL